MDKSQKFQLTRKLNKLENSITPHEYRGVADVIALIKEQEYLSKVFELAKERENGWDSYWNEFHEHHALQSKNGVELAIKTLKEGMVDLSTCNKGDKLLTCHGNTLYYDRPTKSNEYLDHIIKYADGSAGGRTNDGYVFAHNRKKTDENIIEILKS